MSMICDSQLLSKPDLRLPEGPSQRGFFGRGRVTSLRLRFLPRVVPAGTRFSSWPKLRSHVPFPRRMPAKLKDAITQNDLPRLFASTLRPRLRN